MDKLKKIIPIPALVLITVLTISFRYIPKGSNWNGYNIIYIQKDVAPQKVKEIFTSAGILEYVSLDNQRIPIMLTKNSPEETMLRLNINEEENRYLYLRQNYFFDSKGEYQLFYIPQLYENHIAQALSILKQNNLSAGADTALPYLWLLPVIVIVLAIILAIFAKNKLMFIVSSIIPCIYICCNAFYSSAIAVIILLLCIFVFSNMWKRKGALEKIIRNYFLIAGLAVSVIAAFSTALLPGLFYLLTLAGTICAGAFAVQLKAFSLRKTDYSPVLIRSAAKIPVYGNKSKIIMPIILASSVIVIAYFSLNSLHLTGIKSDSKVLLPGKISQQETDSQLPDFEAFSRWNWNVLTSPYKSLNTQTSGEENSVMYPRYTVEDGVIVRSNQTMYYDNSFKSRIYDGIDQLDFVSIESVLKLQGKDFTAGYTTSDSYNISIFSIIMMITGFFVLLFIYFSAMIGKGGRK